MHVERRVWKSMVSGLSLPKSHLIPAPVRSRRNMLITLRLVAGKGNRRSSGSRPFAYAFKAMARSVGIGTSPAVRFFASLALIEIQGGFVSKCRFLTNKLINSDL